MSAVPSDAAAAADDQPFGPVSALSISDAHEPLTQEERDVAEAEAAALAAMEEGPWGDSSDMHTTVDDMGNVERWVDGVLAGRETVDGHLDDYGGEWDMDF